MKTTWMASLLALASAFAAAPSPASACGGFFCSASPVDQNAERIIFAVDEANDSTDMIVQITYQGDDDAFAWVLPVAAVPQNRQVFPASALSVFDAQTGPTFQPPPECQGWGVPASAGNGGGPRDAGSAAPRGDAGVTVHVMERIDGYEVAVIESQSSDAAFAWLLENKYRLSSVMKPYIDYYTSQGMKFLALRLAADATARDIKPFKMTLPGQTPTIPLRLTAVAAEPEMGVVVWILGQRRYEPANAEEITIPKEELRWRPNSWPIRTNWTQLVARHVDARGGKAWVVEQAGESESLRQLAQSSFANTQEQVNAREALLRLLNGRPYMTRLYTRVAAEEMTYDPTFRRSDKGIVARQRELPYIEEICSRDAATPPPTRECDFASCGQLGECREVMNPSTKVASAACACAPGTTARTTFDPQGQPMVTCQDERMSFMNPGERDEAGNVFSDPCTGFSCGEHGRCVAMNLTPTCECEQGYVAFAKLGPQGQRLTECAMPMQTVPKSFYNRRPPALAAGMIAGRAVDLPPPSGDADVDMPGEYGEPMPGGPANPAGPTGGDSGAKSGCSATSREAESGGALTVALFAGLALFLKRRRRS
jgi:hypothetical protein